mmetsp:Transcript_94142/g.170041  ORF Transcript_94142/g.170041 Transcript_94142/m.170041 type:complete len:102 (+) Transcript_94142:90-395(+)
MDPESGGFCCSLWLHTQTIVSHSWFHRGLVARPWLTCIASQRQSGCQFGGKEGCLAETTDSLPVEDSQTTAPVDYPSTSSATSARANLKWIEPIFGFDRAS